ncbi:methionyl-tRNA formyltransferase [Rhodoferax lacus]|uniref:Methionyl-tRNA formyltransferase n=1 Tax=Rhodoferax lacus TaxID=2184758 RepID=A0A3E1RB79_9BURK|nr:methionyl-tRNA formyltransferase [Rhodoferax lacus]
MAAQPLRVIFAGTPEFARLALERLHAAGAEIVLVLSQPDRPAGRGMKLQASAVKQFALEHNLPVAQPQGLRLDGKYAEDAAAARQALLAADADVMVVAAYGLILPQWVLDLMQIPRADGRPRLGCLNIHGSLLPRWRGAAPIHRAIEAGDSHTGVTIMQMDVGLDTGDMLLQQSLPIAPDDSTATLHDKVAELGADMVVQALELALGAGLQPVPQPVEGVTYAHKIEKQEAAIDWRLDAQTIGRRVRAFNPFPGASAVLGTETIKVWKATPGPQQGAALPGTVMAVGPEGIAVAAGGSTLLLQELQRPGGKRLAAADFLRGFDLKPGMQFELPALPDSSSAA